MAHIGIGGRGTDLAGEYWKIAKKTGQCQIVAVCDPNTDSNDYIEWGKGIYAEVSEGKNPSPTLDRWLAAGGLSLCAQAAR